MRKILGVTMLIFAAECVGIGYACLFDPMYWWIGAVMPIGLLGFMSMIYFGITLMVDDAL
jgi:hypothetical protein